MHYDVAKKVLIEKCQENGEHEKAIWAMKKEKIINRIKNNPKAVRFEELKKVLTEAGFSERPPKGGSSHYVYYHVDLDRIVVLTRQPNTLPEYQVKDALRAVELLERSYDKE
jgi:predicted RNA binding protein YcfA (HicA-like mRNA interferase family)